MLARCRRGGGGADRRGVAAGGATELPDARIARRAAAGRSGIVGDGTYAGFVRDLPADDEADLLKPIPRKQRAEVRKGSRLTI